jgi:hypothetical protein
MLSQVLSPLAMGYGGPIEEALTDVDQRLSLRETRACVHGAAGFLAYLSTLLCSYLLWEPWARFSKGAHLLAP